MTVFNAAARLIHQTSRCQYITPLLRQLHWLRSRERVDFKLAVLIFRCLHGLAPGYLSDDIRRVAITNRRRLRSSSSDLLTVSVRPTRLVTMGDRAFPVAGSRLIGHCKQLLCMYVYVCMTHWAHAVASELGVCLTAGIHDIRRRL